MLFCSIKMFVKGRGICLQNLFLFSHHYVMNIFCFAQPLRVGESVALLSGRSCQLQHTIVSFYHQVNFLFLEFPLHFVPNEVSIVIIVKLFISTYIFTSFLTPVINRKWSHKDGHVLISRS